MGKIETTLKSEITRLARKEVNQTAIPLRKQLRDLARQKLPPYDPASTETTCAVLTWGEGLVLPHPLGASNAMIDD